MYEINWDYNVNIEGIIDTGIIVITHFNNPIQDDMIRYLEQVFLGIKRLLIPLSTFIGAYHILTSYLKVSRLDAKLALSETLNLNSEYFFPLIEKNMVIESLDISSVFNIESWDGYLLYLAKLFKTNNIITIDKKLKKIKEFNIILPVTNSKLNEYHSFLEENIFN